MSNFGEGSEGKIVAEVNSFIFVLFVPTFTTYSIKQYKFKQKRYDESVMNECSVRDVYHRVCIFATQVLKIYVQRQALKTLALDYK